MESISPPEVNWIRPDLEKEKGEIERVLSGFLGVEVTDENFNRLVDSIKKAPIAELSDEEWDELDNADSFHFVRPGHIEDAEEIIEKYNQDEPVEQRRSVVLLKESFLGGKQMETPIIVTNEKGDGHLLSGNTRLMVARALGIRPKVIIAEFK